MAKKGETKKTGTTKTTPEEKDFQGSGVEGAKAAAPAKKDSGVITCEHVLAMQREQGKAV